VQSDEETDPIQDQESASHAGFSDLEKIFLPGEVREVTENSSGQDQIEIRPSFHPFVKTFLLERCPAENMPIPVILNT
jgi:hypothetical protein